MATRLRFLKSEPGSRREPFLVGVRILLSRGAHCKQHDVQAKRRENEVCPGNQDLLMWGKSLRVWTD